MSRAIRGPIAPAVRGRRLERPTGQAV